MILIIADFLRETRDSHSGTTFVKCWGAEISVTQNSILNENIFQDEDKIKTLR